MKWSQMKWSQMFAHRFLSFRIFEQLALALKTEFALKSFNPGGCSPSSLGRLWAYGIEQGWPNLLYV